MGITGRHICLCSVGNDSLSNGALCYKEYPQERHTIIHSPYQCMSGLSGALGGGDCQRIHFLPYYFKNPPISLNMPTKIERQAPKPPSLDPGSAPGPYSVVC